MAMFSASNLCRNIGKVVIQSRHKSKTHWAKLKKKNGSKEKAMNHFDEFYGSVFGKEWAPMRKALLRKSKYAAVVNNYGDADETIEYLTNRGAHCLKKLTSVQQDFDNNYNPKPKEQLTTDPSDKMKNFMSKLQSDEIAEIYPQTDSAPDRIDTKEITLQSGNAEKEEVEEKRPKKYKTLDDIMEEAEIDHSRIIDTSMGLSSELLQQYVPPTMLKGMDDWIPESLHYSYYDKAKDFPLVIEPETEFEYPEHLKVYTYEMDSDMTQFPEPKRCKTGVFNYYPLDCGSVLCALALCLKAGERVLDLCAAPGGKSLLALQTLLPDVLVCNDSSVSRQNRVRRIFKDYLFDFETSNKWRERVVISRVDGRMFTDDMGFDKVLVDVPCTTDRHSVTEDNNNIFRPDRIRERLKIPELQTELLVSALRLCRPGGAVVYSTCALSPVQGDGVLHNALKNAFEKHGIVAVVRDLTDCLSGFASTLKLGAGQSKPKYGQLVMPCVGANFGPTYFARLVRIK